ncbi:hypothetical protein GCM10010433_00350 [Streptomyces pulveraceus]
MGLRSKWPICRSRAWSSRTRPLSDPLAISVVPCGSGFGAGGAVASGDGTVVRGDGTTGDGDGGRVAGLPSSVAVARGGADGAAGAPPVTCALQPAAVATARTASAAAVPARPRIAVRDVLLVVLSIISAPCVSGVPLDGFPLCPVVKARA